MSKFDTRGLIGGVTIAAIGTFAAIHTRQTLPLGTVSSMGPGMFPFALGLLLGLVGVLIVVTSLLRPGRALEADPRSFFTIIASILLFAAMLRPFGLIPSIIVLVVVSSRADSKLSWTAVAILAGALSLGAYLIFVVAIGMPINIFSLPG